MGFLSHQALHDLNRLTYWIGLPSLLFHRIAGASAQVGEVADLLLVVTGATLLALAVAAAVAALGGLGREARGTFVQGVFRGNLAFIGLPVVMYAFAGAGATTSNALLAFGPLVVLYNVLAVLVLLLPGRQGGQSALGGALRGLLTNPILLACLAGLGFSLLQIPLPQPLQRSFAAIGQMALPLALLCIGGTLYSTHLQGSLRWATLGAVLKVALVPGLGFVLARALELSAAHTRIALILLACPTASASYVLVRQLKGDTALASSMIVISNLLAVPAMALVLGVTG